MNKGFTLVEVMVAVVVLVILLVSTGLIVNSVFTMIGDARVRSLASELAEDRMELYRGMDYASLGVAGGIPSGSIPQIEVVSFNGQEFEVQTSIIFIDDEFDDVIPTDLIPTDYKRIRVSVTWEGIHQNLSPVVLVSDVSPRGLETVEGGGTLIVNVINASGEAVEEAQVKILNDTVVPEVSVDLQTNNQGKIMLPGAPACTECYEVEVTKNGYSVEKTYGSDEVTNPLKPHISVIEGELSQVTFAIDRVVDLEVWVTRTRDFNYSPFQGVEFELIGTKTLGTNDQDEPVIKYQQTFVSGPGGYLQIEDLEWDVYTIEIPSESSVDLAGSNPILPIALNPGVASTLKIAVDAASTHSLLTQVTDLNNMPIASASIQIKGPVQFVATGSGGLVNTSDWGQFHFRELNDVSYDIEVAQVGYLTATRSAQISGDVIESFVLEDE